LIDTLNIYEKFIKSGNETIAAIILSEKQQIDQHDTIILYYHGNAAHIDLYWPRFRLLHSCGYPVMIIDYRGYGLSTGKATEDGIYEDGFAALNYIRDSLGNPNVIIYAYSLGSLVGCEIATKHINDKILGLILEAPIGSVETLVQDATYMNMPGAYFTSFKGNNAERIKTFKKPLLWFHGTKDETLAYETNGKLVWNSYSGPEGYHYRVEGGGHANLPKLTGYNRYRTMVQKFITGKGSSDPFLVKK
jgi:pimeloyl-ACP methyl ester carboxylesterase